MIMRGAAARRRSQRPRVVTVPPRQRHPPAPTEAARRVKAARRPQPRPLPLHLLRPSPPATARPAAAKSEKDERGRGAPRELQRCALALPARALLAAACAL